MSVDLIDALGLRERKKLETRLALVSVTLELFAERASYHDGARRNVDRLRLHEASAVHLCGLSWVGAGEGSRSRSPGEAPGLRYRCLRAQSSVVTAGR